MVFGRYPGFNINHYLECCLEEIGLDFHLLSPGIDAKVSQTLWDSDLRMSASQDQKMQTLRPERWCQRCISRMGGNI